MGIRAYFFYFFFIFFLYSNTSFAVTYYVSAEGDDKQSGTNIESAWKTLERVNRLVPKPGDSILFRRGDAWTGTIYVNMWGLEGKPLVYGAYGSGVEPEIYGSEIITGWEKHSDHIFKAKFKKKINQLFVDNERMRAARYPNKGFIFISSVSGTQEIISDELDRNIDYSGAKWFGRTNYFTTSLLNVESSQSKTLKLESAPRFPFKTGLGFFLVNKLEFLDQPGEWYFDEKTTLFIFGLLIMNRPIILRSGDRCMLMV